MTRYLSLAEFWYLAEHVTGIDAATLIKASRVELADSTHRKPDSAKPSSTQTRTTRQRYSPVGSRGTIRCLTATSERHGRASCCSSTSTTGHGTTRNPTLTTQSKRCSKLRHERSTRRGSRSGCANGSPSQPESGSCSAITDRNRSRRARFRRCEAERVDRRPGAPITPAQIRWHEPPRGPHSRRIGAEPALCVLRFGIRLVGDPLEAR